MRDEGGVLIKILSRAQERLEPPLGDEFATRSYKKKDPPIEMSI